MTKNVKNAILLLIALSMIGLIGMQYYWLSTNFVAQKEELNRDVKKAMKLIGEEIRSELNNRVSINTDRLEEIDLYFENQDSTFQFLLEPLSKKLNKDGSDYQMNMEVYHNRLKQFETIMDDLHQNSPPAIQMANGDLVEIFLVLYGQESKKSDRERSWEHLVDYLEIEESIDSHLAEFALSLDYEFGIYHKEDKSWEYLSEAADSSMLLSKGEVVHLSEDGESLYLSVQNPKGVVLRSMTRNLLLSVVLLAIICASFFYLLSIIWKQKRNEEIKTDFINNMTHEFKTPLATIAFATANINNPKVIKNEQMVRQFTKVIMDENKRMNRQVEQVLTAALADKKALKLKKEKVDLHEIIREGTRNIQLKFQNQEANLNLLLEAKYAMVNGDPVHLTNMISNLLDNAQKYSQEAAQISLETQNTDTELFIKITDQGIGMDKEAVSKIFDKFYRVPTGNLHNIKGFGLGLSYVKTVAEQHGGQISVESKINEGSTFTISLPLRRPEQ